MADDRAVSCALAAIFVALVAGVLLLLALAAR